ncbi:MAG: c-type cytochrome biogenesis protein CcmI [Pseudomonadota bacterium]|nr:MAG: c-type cytochrome biogenesis protein CcmI [Pseudomonadota bacterium]
MTLFTIIAAAMVLAALGLVLPPLLGRGRGSAETRQELNVVIHRERLSELDADLAEGAIDETQHQQARAELERDLLENTADDGGEIEECRPGGRWAGDRRRAGLAGVGGRSLLAARCPSLDRRSPCPGRGSRSLRGGDGDASCRAHGEKSR